MRSAFVCFLAIQPLDQARQGIAGMETTVFAQQIGKEMVIAVGLRQSRSESYIVPFVFRHFSTNTNIKSFTFVRVGPVIRRSSVALRKG